MSLFHLWGVRFIARYVFDPCEGDGQMSCVLSMLPCEECGKLIEHPGRVTRRFCPECKYKRDLHCKTLYAVIKMLERARERYLVEKGLNVK